MRPTHSSAATQHQAGGARFASFRQSWRIGFPGTEAMRSGFRPTSLLQSMIEH
jgi:hypothetical protein